MRCTFPLVAGLAPFALSLACAGGFDEASQRRCDDVTAQIDQALHDYTESGILLPGAVACELTPTSFDPRVSSGNVVRVLGQFTAACDTEAEECSGAAPQVGPPQSIPPYVQPEPVSGSSEDVTKPAVANPGT
jgi:hypothetical protein